MSPGEVTRLFSAQTGLRGWELGIAEVGGGYLHRTQKTLRPWSYPYL